jgi:hypothetical protein
VVKKLVAENPQGTPENWQQHILTWAKENGSGEYRLGYWDGYELTYEYNEYLYSFMNTTNIYTTNICVALGGS